MDKSNQEGAGASSPIRQILSQCEARYVSSFGHAPIDRALATFDLSQWLIESLMLRRRLKSQAPGRPCHERW
jgi:hypothetical protein